MAALRSNVLVIAARQAALVSLLEEAGLTVEARTRPVDGREEVSADVAVVFRGRLIGRGQAQRLVERGIPVVEVMTVDPPGASTAEWIRLSNRMSKTDLVQVVRAALDWAESRRTASKQAA